MLCPHGCLSPAGLWLGMLAGGLLGTVALVVYTARIDWKFAAEEVSERWALARPSMQSDCSPKALRARRASAAAICGIRWGSWEGAPRGRLSLHTCSRHCGGTPDGARTLSNHKETCTH